MLRMSSSSTRNSGKNFEVDFHKVYLQAERMATAVNVNPLKPRACPCQRNRPNAQVETVEEQYRVNVAVPFSGPYHCRTGFTVFGPRANFIQASWIGSISYVLQKGSGFVRSCAVIL